MHTKNKLQLKHTGKHIKIKTDVNYVWFDNAIQTQAESGFNRDFNRENRTRNLYLNNAIEYEFSSKIGAVAKTSYKSEDYRIQSFFETDDSDIAAFIGRSIDESVYELNQINDHKETQFVQDIRLNLKSSWGNHFFGYRWRYNQLENSKNTNFSNQFDFEFNNPNQSLDYRLHNGIYSYQNAFGELSVNTDLTLSEMEFPFGETREKDYFFQYSLALNYDFSETASLDFMGSKSLGNFPLEKIIGGSYFQNFQTIFLPSQFLEPFFNTTYTLSYFKNFRSRNFEIDAAVLHGISENLNNQTFSNKLILQTADQLQSSYTAYSVKFKKTLGQTKLILEPEMLNNSFQYLVAGNLQTNKSHRYLLGFKVDTGIFEFLDTNLLSKYSHFEFENVTDDFQDTFNFLTNSITLKSKLMSDQLLMALGFKSVYFLQSKDQFNHLDFVLRKKTQTNWSFFLSISNLLNAKKFQTRDFNQAVFTSTENSVFERYLNLGIAYKFK